VMNCTGDPTTEDIYGLHHLASPHVTRKATADVNKYSMQSDSGFVSGILENATIMNSEKHACRCIDGRLACKNPEAIHNWVLCIMADLSRFAASDASAPC